MTAKAMSLRLPEDLAAELHAVARTDEEPISEAVRAAISKHIAERRADKGFQERLKKLMEEDREVLERLSRNESAAGSGSRGPKPEVKSPPNNPAGSHLACQ